MSMKFKTIQTAPVKNIGEVNDGKSEVDDTCIFRDITSLIPQLVQYQTYADRYYYESVNDYDDGEYDDLDDDWTTIDRLQEENDNFLKNQEASRKQEKNQQKSAVNGVERADVVDSKSE